MLAIDQGCREFIAKNIADMGKAILTVGFASYFFERLPVLLRVGFVLLGFVCLTLSVYVYAWKGEEK